MSAWVKGKLDLKCSLDVLKRAIANLMPQWAAHIQIDPNGKLEMYRYRGGGDEEARRRKDIKVSLLLPGSGNPHFSTPPGRDADNDWGFAVGPDGKWQVHFAEYNAGQAQQLANSVKAEVSRMKMLAIAKLKGYQATSTEKDKSGKAIIDIVVDEDKAREMLQMMQKA